VPETKPPMFTKKIEPCRAFEGESGKFMCTFTGYPEPHVTWFRENFPIKDSQDFQINTTDTSSTLVIREVYIEDSGVFSVKAENRGGTAKSSANLVVEERKEQVRGAIPPSFVKTIQDATAKVGQLVRLDAIIAGSKPFDVYWLKNGKKIAQDITHKQVEEEDQYTLLILEAAAEDVGSYECVAINKVGEARCQASIQVLAAPVPKSKSTPKKTDKKNKAPECIEPLKDSTVRESQPATFRCRFSGAPAPEVKWFRGEIIVKQSRYFRMSVENDVYTLRISEAFPEDEGLYKCVATNSAGTASTSANLKVVVPDVTEVPPSVSPLADLTVPEGTPARFVTTVTGTPTPKITWSREGAIIKASRDFQMFQDGGSCSLVIRQTYPEDQGVYTCRATNASGQAETSARLTIESKR
jgi:titin